MKITIALIAFTLFAVVVNLVYYLLARRRKRNGPPPPQKRPPRSTWQMPSGSGGVLIIDDICSEGAITPEKRAKLQKFMEECQRGDRRLVIHAERKEKKPDADEFWKPAPLDEIPGRYGWEKD